MSDRDYIPAHFDLRGRYVHCDVCGKRKQPRGRSAPLECNMCDWECPGYDAEPRVGSLWPEELASEFGYPVCTCCNDIVWVNARELED